MGSPEILDFAALLTPVPGENPAGEDLRADYTPTSPYQQLKDVRTAARADERQMLFDEEGVPGGANWDPILKLAPALIGGKSKDFELAAWLVEALVRKHGFAGLRDGLRLLRELAETFWDGLYPLPDEDGVESRIYPLTGLNGEGGEGTLIDPIGRIELTQGSDLGPFAYWQFKQAADLDVLGDPERKQQRISEGATSLEQYDRAVAETPAEFFINLVEDIRACLEECGKLYLHLDEKCGNYAPPSSQIRAALEACLDAVNSTARHKLEVEPEPVAEEGGDMVLAEGGTAPAAAVASGAIATREDAFRLLGKVADFFRKTEPHSPVSYALEQAVRWGKMPLPDLLNELIVDPSAREQMFKLVGIIPPPE